MSEHEGDYVIRGVKGEFYPCREDIFLETYEQIEENAANDKKQLQEK